MNANFTNEQVVEAIAEFIQELTANAATEVGVGYNGNITIFKNDNNVDCSSLVPKPFAKSKIFLSSSNFNSSPFLKKAIDAAAALAWSKRLGSGLAFGPLVYTSSTSCSL